MQLKRDMSRRIGMRQAIGARQDDTERATRYLYYWLLLALFFEYARPASYLPFLRIPFLYSLIPLSLFAVSLFTKGLRPMRDIFADPISKWVPIFLGLIVFSAVHADVTMYVFNTFIMVLGYTLLFLMITRLVTTHERLRGVVVTLLIAHLFLLAMNPIVVLDPTDRHYIQGASFLGDGNDFSLSLCLLLPCVIELAPHIRNRWMRILAWASAGILVMAIIGTQSRGAALGLGAVLFFLWLRSRRKMVTLAGAALVGLIVLVYAPPVYFERMGTIAEYEEDGSAQGRLAAWEVGARMALDHPLTGVGAGQFPWAFGTTYRTAETANMPWMTAHSSYFLVLGELGFPGLLCILMLTLGNLHNNMRLRRDILRNAGPIPGETAANNARLLLFFNGAVVGLAVAGAFLSASYYPHFYVLTALLVSARRLASDQTGVPVGARPVAPNSSERRATQVGARS